jgi:hypothetical protein
MNWQDLAGPLIKLGAPTIGTALGGPLGGMIGGAVGNILGSAFGVEPTPDAIDKAIKTTPVTELQDKLAAAEADAQAKYPALAEIAKAEAEAQAKTAAETQLTMRAEIAAGDPLQRWWRPLYGLELTLECAALAVVIIRDLWGGETAVLTAATQATALLLGYWGLRFAVLGVYVQGRNRWKETTMTGQLAPSVIDQLVKAVKRR